MDEKIHKMMNFGYKSTKFTEPSVYTQTAFAPFRHEKIARMPFPKRNGSNYPRISQFEKIKLQFNNIYSCRKK